MNRSLFVIIAFLIPFFGCAHIPKPVTDFYLRQGIDLRRYERIAVMQFSSPLIEASAGIEASDIIGLELMKKGYLVVERSRVDQVLKEQGLGLTGAIDESSAAEIGKILGVQLLVTGSVGTYKTTSTLMMYGTIVMPIIASSASLSIRMINTKDATVVWAAQGSCAIKRETNPVVPLKAAIEKMFQEFPNK